MNDNEKYKDLWVEDWESFEKYIYYNGETVYVNPHYTDYFYNVIEIVKYIKELDKHFMYEIIEGTTDAKMLKDHYCEYLPFYDKYIHINNHKIMSTPFEVELKQITVERWVSINES